MCRSPATIAAPPLQRARVRKPNERTHAFRACICAHARIRSHMHVTACARARKSTNVLHVLHTCVFTHMFFYNQPSSLGEISGPDFGGAGGPEDRCMFGVNLRCIVYVSLMSLCVIADERLTRVRARRLAPACDCVRACAHACRVLVSHSISKS